MGFNRNILGCKERNTGDVVSRENDLIETYWDVKLTYIVNDFVNGRDLIETYWDVK